MVLVYCMSVGMIIISCYRILLKIFSRMEHDVMNEMIREIYLYDEEEEGYFGEKGDGDYRPPEPEIPMTRLTDGLCKRRSKATQRFFENNPQFLRRTKSSADLVQGGGVVQVCEAAKRRPSEIIYC